MKVITRVSVVLALALLLPVAFGRLAGPWDVPVERILPQLEKRVAEHPDDAHAHYLLGRVHAAAFVRASESVRARNGFDPKEDVLVDDGHSPIANDAWQRSRVHELDPRPQSAELMLTHLGEAVRHLSRAVEMAPDKAVYQLGLACAFDSGAHLATQVDSTWIAESLRGTLDATEANALEKDIAIFPLTTEGVLSDAEAHLLAAGARALPVLSAHRADSDAKTQFIVARVLTRIWRDLAIQHYERAFTIAWTRDGKLEQLGPEGAGSLVSYEAGAAYVRLVSARKAANKEEAERVEEVKAALSKLDETPFGYVTPILVPDASDATLDSLFDGASACFDLAGFGVEQRWPWPRESASLLVWDPECAGAITSGRQLFGSATWWMFFEDGYSALDALDADRDGWLTGDELEGLALWRDVDRDGVSDPGEVETLAARGVTAIATRADGLDGISPMRSRGAVLADGRELPTFDWIASPIPGS